MAKKKRRAPERRKKTPTTPPEPKGGPFARREAFVQERLGKLEPRGTAPAARAPEEAPEAPAKQRPETDYRRSRIQEYRRKQKAQVEREGIPAGAAREGGASRSGETKTPQDEEEDELFGPEVNPASGLLVPPPMPPMPPPANNWIPIGPSVLRKGQGATLPATSGRAIGIAVAQGGNRVYLAAANGGVWRSDDAGQSWRSLMDAWDLNPTTASSDSLACGSIAIDPNNADRIFVGTGDGDEAIFLGVGPVVSFDGGNNWATEPVAPGSPALAGSSMNAIVVDPGNGDRAVAGSFLGVYRREANPAGGFHWARKAGPTGWITSVVVARTGGATTFYAAPSNGPVFSSNDGDTWAPIGSGFPSTNVGRVGLGVRATDPAVVYALVAASNGSILGIWRLDTGGGQWRQVTGHPTDLFGTAAIGFQGTYDLAIAVDPNNANLIYVGGSTKASGGEWSGSVYRCAISGGGTASPSMTTTYIGASVHADIHCLTFAPGDSNKLWLGCDGGAYYSTNPTGSGNVFQARNTGVQTLTMNRVDHHPTEDAVVFAGTQDNGGCRFTGEEAWLHSVWGDCGDFVINWADPYKVLATYVRNSINRATDGGTRYNYNSVAVPLPAGDSALFYAPLVGTPPSGTVAEAGRIAFGSRRVWISDTFGGGWSSIPANNSTDDLGGWVRALRFASFNKLYAGTTNGRVYQFTKSGASWTRTRLDTMGGANSLGLAGAITSIAIDPSDASGNSIYICFGGNGDFRHVWRFDGTQWQARSGPSAGAATSLLDVQANAIVCDPANPNTVYVGADIGVWRSTDGGMNWETFSSGLPDAGVLDLDLHNPRRLLRASTYGRGVWEYALDATNLAGIQLYVRDTQLDQGRFTTVNGLPDPTAQGETVRHWRGPDIKIDTPDASGNYQYPITPGTTINFEEFTNQLTDDFQNVATHATATIVSRVYVQVHNRGVTKADNVRVMLLLANASAGLPNLPAGFAANVQSGTPINTANWKTVGIATVNDVRVGFPRIAAFDLPSSMLPPPANLAGNQHHCVLALVHHASDPFTAAQTVPDLMSPAERKAAHKNLTVVQFTGTLPAPPPVVMPLRFHNPSVRRRVLTTLEFRLNRYKGRVRIYFPKLQLDGSFAELVVGARPGRDFDPLRKWAQNHIKAIEQNQRSRTPFNPDWSKQRIADVHAALESGLMITAGRSDPIQLRNIVLEPESSATIFLFFDRPEGAQIGTYVPIEVMQLEARSKKVIGGMSGRIEFVPAARRGIARRLAVSRVSPKVKARATA